MLFLITAKYVADESRAAGLINKRIQAVFESGRATECEECEGVCSDHTSESCVVCMTVYCSTGSDKATVRVTTYSQVLSLKFSSMISRLSNVMRF